MRILWRRTVRSERPEWIDRVRARLVELRTADPTLRQFGAYNHQYRLGPPLTQADIVAAEAHYQITLPTEYREFLLHLGNGGAGPGYGLERFGILAAPVVPRNPTRSVILDRDGGVSPLNDFDEFSQGFDELFFTEMQRLKFDRSQLTRPFPLLRPWARDDVDEPDDEDDYFRWKLDILDPMFKYGSLELSDHGCGQKHKLIVSGNEAGSVWVYDEQDRESIYPYGARMLPPDAPVRRYTFAEWYEDWVKDYLNRAHNRS